MIVTVACALSPISVSASWPGELFGFIPNPIGGISGNWDSLQTHTPKARLIGTYAQFLQGNNLAHILERIGV